MPSIQMIPIPVRKPITNRAIPRMIILAVYPLECALHMGLQRFSPLGTFALGFRPAGAAACG
jgi:hypothetical protein